MPGEKTDLEGKAISSEKIVQQYSFNSSSNGGNGVVRRIIVNNSTESHENPFGETGELSKKANFIVRNSTISRTEIRIADPDATPEPNEACEEPMLSSSAAPVSAESPKNAAAGDSLAGAKENGKLDEPLSPQDVEVKLADASLPPEGEAEAVKVPKDKKCKCCVLQ